MLRRMLSLAFAFTFAPVVLASDYFVDALNGDDLAGTGSAATPWKTITRAHQAPLAALDVVHVAPGVHDAALGEVFPITLKSMVRVVGAGADRTFVRGAGILFKSGAGQTWFHLSDMALQGASTAVSQEGPGGSDTFLVLERLVLENNGVGLRVSDGPGIYMQVALFNCFLRANQIAVHVDEAWQGFGGVFAFLYGCTLIDNVQALVGTTSFGNRPAISIQRSIVKKNGDEIFAADFTFMAPTSGCVLADPALVGSNGNVSVPPAFVNYSGLEPHLRIDSAARDISAPPVPWPPAPAPGVPGPDWWGLTFASSFASVGDIDGRPRADAIADAGCDEVETPFAYVSGEPSIGKPVDLVALGPPGGMIAVYLSLGASSSFATPYGIWQLDPPFVPLGVLPLDASGHLVANIAPTGNPAVVGIDVYLQGHTSAPPLALTPAEWMRFLP